MEMQYKNITVECKKLEKANTLSAVFSTSDMDRHGDIVLQNWELGNYKANPVILNSHNSYDATEVIGKATMIEVVDGKLQGEIEFAVDENPKAKVIHDLYAGGFLHAFSVGFIPKEYADMNIITNAELLEISAVSVPANQMALAKAKGIDVDILKSEALQDPDEQPLPEVLPVEGDEAIHHDEDLAEVVHTITEEDLENNEGLEEHVEVGDEVTLPVAEEAVEDTTTKLLNAVRELREEQKGRTLSTELKKEVNKAIRELLEAKKL